MLSAYPKPLVSNTAYSRALFVFGLSKSAGLLLVQAQLWWLRKYNGSKQE